MPDFAETPDFLNKSTILSRACATRQYFDPMNVQHLESLQHFIRTGNWGDVQFFREFPFSDVPMTVLMKYAGHLLNATRETDIERASRIAQRLRSPLAAAVNPTV